MFPFPSRNKMSDTPEVPATPPKVQEVHPLDALTGGAFSAATSGERASRVREWLAGNPTPEQVQEVFKELSVRDKAQAEWGRLILGQSTWTAHNRIEALASEQLKMHIPDPAAVRMVRP